MIRYVARRIVYMVVALFIIVSITFFISKALPGDPFNDPKLTPQIRQQLFEKYGLDEPLYVQYAKYMANVAQGDLGNSFYFESRPVSQMILQRLPVSAFIGIQAVIFGLVIGMVLGIVAALWHNTIWDTLAVVVAILGVSVPSFVLGTRPAILARAQARVVPDSLLRELDLLRVAFAGPLGVRHLDGRPLYADGDARGHGSGLHHPGQGQGTLRPGSDREARSTQRDDPAGHRHGAADDLHNNRLAGGRADLRGAGYRRAVRAVGRGERLRDDPGHDHILLRLVHTRPARTGHLVRDN